MATRTRGGASCPCPCPKAKASTVTETRRSTDRRGRVYVTRIRQCSCPKHMKFRTKEQVLS